MKQKLWLTLVTYLSYCIDKELYKAIDYLKTQVEVLVEQQEKQNKRILLTNKQRMRVAAKAKRLSRKLLERCTVLFTADTIIGWYNKLIAQKYDGSHNRTKPGRPQITDQIVYLGHKISKTSVKNILIENGYNPEPDLTVKSTSKGLEPSTFGSTVRLSRL